MSPTEQDVAEKDGTLKTIYIAVGLISLLLVGGLIYLAKRPAATGDGQPKLEGALRPGSTDFEKYKALIVVDNPEATEGARAIGDMVMTLSATVRNFTGKTINGLEVRGSVVDMQGAPVKERNVILIPNTYSGMTELDHNKTLPVKINLEGMSKESDRANIKIEVTAIRFK